MKQYVLKSDSEMAGQLPSDFLADLNSAQIEAVLHQSGPVLVIAGAGSGKTRTLVHRVARLVNEGVSPESVLLLTFTRKAAEEMLRRATQLLDGRCHRVAGGTFHSFGNTILREFGSHLGYTPQFTILDRSDSEEWMGRIRKGIGESKTDKRFPKKSTFLDVLSKSVNTGQSISYILSADYPQFEEFEPFFVDVGQKYAQIKQASNVMDYDDLLVNLHKLLTEYEQVRAQLSQRYRYIMVDEYQDTNSLQSEIIRALAGERMNVMAVGDDAQSIYSFRGANFQNIIRFPDQFSGARVITLEQNYRSCQPILDMTNDLISYASEKYAKSLFTDKSGGAKPVYIETLNDNQQSQFVAQKILELREEGVELNRIAVLFRSGWHSNDLEVELKSRNIPFAKYGGFKFSEAAHVKDVLAYLTVIDNPADQLSWMRILSFLEGVGPKAAQDIAAYIQAHRDTLPELDWKPFQGKKFFPDLQVVWGYARGWMAAPGTPAEMLESAIDIYEPFFKKAYDNYAKRKHDLSSLLTIAERYSSLERFLAELTLDPPEATQIGSEPIYDDEKVSLSTIHSAKGLEWHTVFLISVIDGYLPSFRALNDYRQIEEERRLLYVAMTRAQEKLFMIRPQLQAMTPQYGGMPSVQFSRLSRFLEEGNLLDSHVEKWALVEDRGPSKYRF